MSAPDGGGDAATGDPGGRDPFVVFWSERRLCTLASLRADGSIHQVPVGATYDPERYLARVISSGSSYKARNLAARPGTRVSVCQVEGRWWSTLEGTATVTSDPEAVAEAERRYALRYRRPRPNPDRVVIEIKVDRVLGNVRPGRP
ncbi:TIGR03618 family F420-dependent PPOX class oxidoreductase [Nocardiopsis sp. RSe5-2]|uniref:TIGR03618 family F420-dependent PPOX class oxidoreductase n=1 Tax=Nocardiopsis endophytica TaxID=3018445 RepID=A0ABT4U622_9ACTN|nr:TIGR03618 family F420-dependent PPOX class oxidoreductase [Nocardiopsis endophytica]MDA2811939.1 TIGR03618 family F420-dependent PPOX class oxidoreductase [Nocardiopsis endophytica]